MNHTISDTEFEKQLKAARKQPIGEPAAKTIQYQDGLIFVELVSGWNFSFSPKVFEEFDLATESDLKTVQLLGQHTLACPNLDVHIGIGSVIIKLLGEKFIESEISRKRGKVRSEKKQNASRVNGKLGGRPRKQSA
jgi:hypothetical protein